MKNVDRLILRMRRIWITASRLGPGRLSRYVWERMLATNPAQRLVVTSAARRATPSRCGPLGIRAHSPFPEGHQATLSNEIPMVQGEAVWSDSSGWSHTTALGRFHVHYLHWLLPLAPGERQRWLERWLTDHALPGASVAWHPYVVATRTQALLALVPVISDEETTASLLTDSLRWNQEILRMRAERALGGNHLIRDLQARVSLSAHFGDGETAPRAQEFIDELDRQLFSDGVHTERSPSYHGVVLGDARQVRDDLDPSEDRLKDRLSELIDRMQSAWLALQHHDGSPGRFNDSPLLDQRYVEWLDAACAKAGPLNDSGFRVFESRGTRLIADAGPPSPSHLPGHAHAEIGAFELSTPTAGVVVRNVGTSIYESGERRTFERSTAAHTTLVIDRQSQTDLWSSFRMGPIPDVKRYNLDDGLMVAHGGYRDRAPGSPIHSRTFTAELDGSFVIRDVVRSAAPVHALLSLYTSLAEPQLSHEGARIGPLRFEVNIGQFAVRPCTLAASMHESEPGWQLFLDFGNASNHDVSLKVSPVPVADANG